MRTTSIYSLLVLSAYALIPTYCSPAPNCEVGQACVNNVARDENVALEAEAGLITPSAQAAINFITNPANKVIINLWPACFWGGYTVVQGVNVYADSKIPEFERLVVCRTIEYAVTLSGQIGASVTWPRIPDWRDVSLAYAGVVQNEVSVLLGQVIPSDSIWPAEERVLQQNTGVTSITRYLLNSQGQIVRA